jgi:hypothetical protein
MLRGLGQNVVASTGCADQYKNPVSCGADNCIFGPCEQLGTCNWLEQEYDFFTDSSAWQACMNASGQAQIKSVADNAAFYYGPNSPAAIAAQQAAAEQMAQVPLDTANIANQYQAGTVQMPQLPDALQNIPGWVWIAAAAAAGYILLKR